MKPLVIFGTSKFARLVHHCLTRDGKRSVAAFTVDRDSCSGTAFCDLPVVPFDGVKATFPPQYYDMIIAIGYKDMNDLRRRKYEEAMSMGYTLASYVHSSTVLPDNVQLGANCLIFERNVLQPFVRIGDNCIIWSSNVIAHDSVLGDHCFVSSGVVIAGETHIGDSCFLGIGALVGPHLTVGRKCIIGAGALLMRDAEDYGIYGAEPSVRRKAPSHRVQIL
jgi:sugar O-acyltransferase (sialic acid O-acetyltransferase NeuD family)